MADCLNDLVQSRAASLGKLSVPKKVLSALAVNMNMSMNMGFGLFYPSIQAIKKVNFVKLKTILNYLRISKAKLPKFCALQIPESVLVGRPACTKVQQVHGFDKYCVILGP